MDLWPLFGTTEVVPRHLVIFQGLHAQPEWQKIQMRLSWGIALITHHSPRTTNRIATMANSQAVSRRRHDLAELSITMVMGLTMAITTLLFCVMPFTGKVAGSRDFVSYWTAGRQLIHHANPYDRETIAAMEHAAGLDPRAVLIMRNPPWALPLAAPLGLLDLRAATILWSALQLGCLIYSVLAIRRLYGSQQNYYHWLGLGFTPAIIAILMGQTSLLALAGLCLFLRYYQSRPFTAGLALWLCALKPHLFLPIGAALVAWIVLTRAWKIVAGAAAALAATSAIATLIDPHAWADYLGLMRSPAVTNDFIPCLGDAIHHWLWPHTPWTRYLLAAAACLWALWYFWLRRREWDWVRDGGLLMLVSLLCAPYCWLNDQCLAIPALLGGTYAARSRNQVTLLALVNLLAFVQLCMVRINSPLWLWAMPFWLGWYLWATATRGRAQAQAGAEA